MTAIPHELDLDLPKPLVAPTEADLTWALHDWYGRHSSPSGARFATAAQVRSQAGFDARRTCDFVAMDLWPSKGLDLIGHEIKVSRQDWIRELAEPEKAAEFIPYMNRWWIVVAERRMVRDGELPDGWGLMAMDHGSLTVVRKAERRQAKPLTPTRLAALLRTVGQTAEYLERRKHETRNR